MEGHQGCSEPVRNRHQQDIHSKGPRFRLIQLSTSFTVLSLKNDSGESSISTPVFFFFQACQCIHSFSLFSFVGQDKYWNLPKWVFFGNMFAEVVMCTFMDGRSRDISIDFSIHDSSL